MPALRRGVMEMSYAKARTPHSPQGSLGSSFLLPPPPDFHRECLPLNSLSLPSRSPAPVPLLHAPSHAHLACLPSASAPPCLPPLLPRAVGLLTSQSPPLQHYAPQSRKIAPTASTGALDITFTATTGASGELLLGEAAWPSPPRPAQRRLVCHPSTSSLPSTILPCLPGRSFSISSRPLDPVLPRAQFVCSVHCLLPLWPLKQNPPTVHSLHPRPFFLFPSRSPPVRCVSLLPCRHFHSPIGESQWMRGLSFSIRRPSPSQGVQGSFQGKGTLQGSRSQQPSWRGQPSFSRHWMASLLKHINGSSEVRPPGRIASPSSGQTSASPSPFHRRGAERT